MKTELLIQICSIIASVSAAVGIIWKIAKKAIVEGAKDSIESSVSKSAKLQEDRLQALETKLDTQMQNLDEKLDAFISSQVTSNEVTKQALLSTTRDRINEAHTLYMSKGFIGSHSLFVIEELYKSYKILGGNTFVDRQMEDIRGLKIISAEELEYKD